jgi:putative transposase
LRNIFHFNRKEFCMPVTFSQPDDLGLWRFGIISPLLHRTEDAPSMRAQIEELAHTVFFTPDGARKQLCSDTIRDWLCRYRRCGIDGLRNKPRKHQGSTSVSSALAQALADLRKRQPLWTVRRLLSRLCEQGLWNGRKPSRSALYRFTSTHDLNRSIRLPAQPVRCFEYPWFGDLWSADFLHGPMVRRGTTACKSYLHAIIDDATRYIVAARFHSAEDTRSLLDDLMLAIRRFGIPKRFYTDNGAAFRSRHLRLVAAKLGIALPHTPPYTPRGRGKIERFFRTVRDGFLTGRDKTSLDRLNADFSAWVNQYHQTIHHTLTISPLDRKLTDKGPQLKQIAPTQNIDDIFRMEHLTRVGPDGCIRMFKKRFEVPGAIPGSPIAVYYLPWEQNHILVGAEKLLVRPLDTIKNATRFDKPHRGNNPHNRQEDAR